jgi:hypothetical protein
MNGLRMAQAVTQALALDYSKGLGRVHLMGHSHGARVATVAALALQRAAAQGPSPSVAGQLTLVDSPEDNNALISDNDPIEIDAANFNWFELAQMAVARQMTLPGTTTAGSAIVTGINSSTLLAGMGVTCAGIAPGTTVLSVDGPQQITLSVAATADGSSPITFTPPTGSILVENSSDSTTSISLEHEYAAAWYAGSQFTQDLPAFQHVGLFWSPLVAGAQTNLPATSGKTWTDSNLNQSAQFVLGTQAPPATVQTVFTEVSLAQTGTSGPPRRLPASLLHRPLASARPTRVVLAGSSLGHERGGSSDPSRMAHSPRG